MLVGIKYSFTFATKLFVTFIKYYMKPTDAELEILQILWQNGPSTVRFVHDLITKKREAGYTTTLKIMQIMLEKGLLAREIVDRIHIFTALAEEKSTQTQLLDEFVGQAFRGSKSALVMRLLGDARASSAELDKIKLLIDQLDKNTL
jgi:BlaI family penicillinase repressor